MRYRSIRQLFAMAGVTFLLTAATTLGGAKLNVLAANEQTVQTNGQKISITISETGNSRTLSIQDSDKKTEIGSLVWTDQNTTYTLSSDVNHSAITLAGSDNTKNTVSIGYDPDAINSRITTISTSMTSVENNFKSILQQAEGTAITEDVLAGKTFNSASGIGLTGTMPKLVSSSIAINQAANTASKDIILTAKAVANNGNTYSYTDKNGVISKSYSLKSYLNQANDAKTNKATAATVLSGKVFSTVDGIDQSGTMGKVGESNISAVAAGGTKIKVTVKSGSNGVYKYVDNNGDSTTTIDLNTVKDSSGSLIAMGNAGDGEVISGKTFSSNNGFNRTGTMGKVGSSNISAVAAGGTQIKITVKSGANGVYKYVDNNGDSTTTIDLNTVKDSSGNLITMGTANNAQVLEGYTYSSNYGFNRTGTMVNRSTKKSGTPGINSSYPNIPVYDGFNLQYATDTNGTKRIAIAPPEGYYPAGGGSTYVSAAASSFGNASSDKVLSGSTFTSENGLNISGSMTNRGAWTSGSSGNGKVYIPAGYHNGSGYVDLSGAYNGGYSAGVTAADNRANSNSVNWKDGYNNGWSAGNSSGYNSGYSAGSSAGYSSGYTNGKNDGYNEGYAAGKAASTHTIEVDTPFDWASDSSGLRIWVDGTCIHNDYGQWGYRSKTFTVG